MEVNVEQGTKTNSLIIFILKYIIIIYLILAC